MDILSAARRAKEAAERADNIEHERQARFLESLQDDDDVALLDLNSRDQFPALSGIQPSLAMLAFQQGAQKVIISFIRSCVHSFI